MTYWEQSDTKSLSVVFWLSPRMYKFVFDSCSDELEFVVVFDTLLDRLVDRVPLCEPVLELELLFVLLGEAAVLQPYCKKQFTLLLYWKHILRNFITA